MNRRQFLQTTSCGFGYLALADLLQKARAAEPAEHYASPLAPKAPHFAPKAKRVIFLYMQGAPSHVDMFDYKPALIKADGKSLAGRRTLLAPQWAFKPRGKSGLPISDLFPELSNHADDLCIINSMHTDNPAHPQATILLHTGSARFVRPSMGSWVVYGLGTQNENLPGFITIAPQGQGGAQLYGSGFLPAAFEGTPISGVSSGLRNVTPAAPLAVQRRQLDLVQQMNRDTLRRSGDNPQIEGIIESFELGFRMQSTVPDVMDLAKESPKTKSLYGIGEAETDTFGKQCLMARRFAEAGVRFIELTHGNWDQHQQLKAKHQSNARAIDKPIAGLLADLKQRNMLKDTLIVWGGEFGRTPTAQARDGRDHNNRGFSIWLAGGGVKGGLRHGATDELGAAAVQDKVHIHDLHATLLHLMGLDHEKLTYKYAGRDFRLTDVAGNIVKPILT